MTDNLRPRQSNGDRRVHASYLETELVRYDRAGKWYLEKPGHRRRPVTLQQAAAVAWEWQDVGGTVFLNVSGGGRFDAEMMSRAGF